MNRFEEIIQEMMRDIEDIQAAAREKMNFVSDENKLKVSDLANKTIEAINTTINKLKDVAEKVNDEERVGELFERANIKCKEAVDFTKQKISELPGEPRINLDNVLNEIRSTFDKLMQNENVQNATNFVKGLGDDINEFLNKPEVKDKIERAKDITISAAEKGLDALKKTIENIDDNHHEE